MDLRHLMLAVAAFSAVLSVDVHAASFSILDGEISAVVGDASGEDAHMSVIDGYGVFRVDSEYSVNVYNEYYQSDYLSTRNATARATVTADVIALGMDSVGLDGEPHNARPDIWASTSVNLKFSIDQSAEIFVLSRGGFPASDNIVRNFSLSGPNGFSVVWDSKHALEDSAVLSLLAGEYLLGFEVNIPVELKNMYNSYMNVSMRIVPAPAVPIPAAAWLFGSGLAGLCGLSRMRKSAR